jgi:selenoprotein W-related protein
LTAEILNERNIEIYVGSWRLIPSKGGAFEVTINGELLYSKRATGRHAEPGEVRAALLRKRDEVLAHHPQIPKPQDIPARED